jgi:hypothetical protein
MPPSLLKEQKNCSVVMILNEDQLKDNEETLDKYKKPIKVDLPILAACCKTWSGVWSQFWNHFWSRF